MEELPKEIGKRLKEIRHIFNEGGKLSASQFAHLLGETKDNIANYENGRANIPNRLLVALYERGFNPSFILTGKGSMFADNDTGRVFHDKLNGKAAEKGNVTILGEIDTSTMSMDDLIRQAEIYSVAAGDIMKAIQQKSKENEA